MPRKAIPLSETQVRNAKPKDEKQVTLFDGDGMYLLVKANGSKAWRFKYRYNGKEKLISFGTYPETSLAQARKKRLEARSLVQQGIDPVQDKTEKKDLIRSILETTFEKVALEWFETRVDLALNTKTLYERRLKLDILPAIGSLPISEITPAQVLNLVLRPMEARGVGDMTLRVKSIIGQIFRYGVHCEYVDRDVTIDLKGGLKKVVSGHRAAITDPKELAPLLRATDDYDGYFVVKKGLQLLPLLFVRPGELRSMRWKEINFDSNEWSFFSPKTKTNNITPLSKQAICILETLRTVTGKYELCFPSVRSSTRPISDNTFNAALRRMGYDKETVTAQGFRATARTILDQNLSQRVDLIEHQLGHLVKDPLGRAYNRTTFLPQRHRMMQIWSDFLDALKAGKRFTLPKQEEVNVFDFTVEQTDT